MGGRGEGGGRERERERGREGERERGRERGGRERGGKIFKLFIVCTKCFHNTMIVDSTTIHVYYKLDQKGNTYLLSVNYYPNCVVQARISLL